MWERRELKTRAMELFKANYWKSVLAGIIMTFAAGGAGGSAGGSAGNSKDVESAVKNMDTQVLVTLIGVILGVIIIALIVGSLISIFLLNPLQIGCQKYFIDCEYGTPDFNCLGCGFKNGYGKIVLTLFLRGLFIGLWSLLFIIPGIVKSYEYMMIPYILADNPEISRQEAFERSRQMMTGNKWNAFVLDLSFIGWNLLSVLTCGILSIFYVNPYILQTRAQLYHALKPKKNDINDNNFISYQPDNAQQ